MKHDQTPTEKRQDKEANYFARCLLMPEEMFLKQVEILKENTGKTLSTQEAVKKLAKTFKVEEYHVVIRLKELKVID